jgi:hypothetical protein
MRTTTAGRMTATGATSKADVWQLLTRGIPPTASKTLRVSVALGVVFGAAMILASSAIHYHLWKIGYRQIHLIGPSFIAQSVSGLVLALLLLVRPRVFTTVLGMLFLAGSVGALLLSATVGFLGLHDGLNVPWAGWSLITETAGAIVLAFCAAVMLRAR